MEKTWSERDLIQYIAQSSSTSPAGLLKGIGDDCAIIDQSSGEQYIVTTDMLVEDVHFNLQWHPPRELGRKSIAVNLSDIAAMGGIPQFTFLSLSLPDSLGKAWLKEWIHGATSILEEYNCCLAGGDTVRGARFTINVTVIGSVAKNRAILRSTAQKNQSIYVSGYLGSAAAGLLLFEHDRTDLLNSTRAHPFVRRHLDPSPDIVAGRVLMASGMVTAMQDISDGIATDLSHICVSSGVGAIIDESLLPHHPDLPIITEKIGGNASDLMIAGGEDYHLVFTILSGKDAEFEEKMSTEGVTVYKIGKTVEGSEVQLRSKGKLRDITFGGFEH